MSDNVVDDSDAPPPDPVDAAVRRILVAWVRRYASIALLIAILGLIAAVAPSRSPRVARFDTSDATPATAPCRVGTAGGCAAR